MLLVLLSTVGLGALPSNLTKVVPTLSDLVWSYFHLTVPALQSVGETETGTSPGLGPGTTIELNMELLGDKGDPGTATVIVVSWSGSPPPSPSLIVSVAIFYYVCQLENQHTGSRRVGTGSLVMYRNTRNYRTHRESDFGS